MSPAFSRHIFGFSNSLKNFDLFRIYGDDFLSGIPDGIRILDGNLGERGRKLMLAMPLDPIGRKQLQSFTQSRKAAYQQLENSDNKSGSIYPVFGLPYAPRGSLKVIGSNRDIRFGVGEAFFNVPVFGVTQIVSTSHEPNENRFDIVKIRGSENAFASELQFLTINGTLARNGGGHNLFISAL